MIKQAAILVGGLGTRLGNLTRDTPKPLLPVGKSPFLEILVRDFARQGISRILLLSAYHSSKMQRFADELPSRIGKDIKVELSIEPDQAGTGGALWHASKKLDDTFFLMNGDSYFGIPLCKLARMLSISPEVTGILSLRQMPSSPRYGHVKLDGDRVTEFSSTGPGFGTILVNAGVYCFNQNLLANLSPSSSLEKDVLPALAKSGRLKAVLGEGGFIDIGVPDDYARAQVEILELLKRPAIFLDRDGVINADHGYVGSVEHFDWIEGAKEAIKSANEAGYLVFVVTNQAGIARGYYTVEDYQAVMTHMKCGLAEIGAWIDDSRFCPFHIDGVESRYRADSPWRKPAPGMILDLMDHWPIAKTKSFLIGDKQSDLDAAASAGIPGHLFSGGNLADFIRPLIDR
ncbi:hydrolase, HAD-superfamily, subfamily IIIA [Sphingobium chlorophenolicum L-1]|uniref:D,D-heptose 1,7-bisphosphate phosphatase n=1 Tax=Sphingobium chlorophenolicum L-1 TaxID=690566 RepID=F6F0M8_SPHCR|nr:HAD-IIIA family hydrolase [Sphingobium chlorophenolicum]AEG50350.1 hydrolase, HAD-superfamily, subfamily IIIA [Sphingobium chlorophenolicum L-1]